ncbi:MAG: transcription antitermination factor NusB [Ignavibacteriae bacterium]|nr:MAG: transcription antitermination factor NusB [Ignavibacteriota bacterium]
MKPKRRKLREKILQTLYAFEMQGSGLSDIIEDQLKEVHDKQDEDFCKNLIHNIIAERNQIEEYIEKSLVNWEFSRIAVVDKIILRIGIGEFIFSSEIPTKVTINEMIEIAKEYSTANSGKFINGILDNILLELHNDGKVKKVGRGLLEKSISKAEK